MRAVGINVIVKIKVVQENNTASGIFLPNTTVRPDRGVVVSVGSEVKEDIKEGDLVLFNEFAGNNLPDSDDKYNLKIMKEVDILGVLE